MLTLDAAGMIQDPRVRLARATTIERGDMTVVNGIIVHQTGGASASSSLNSYKTSVAGAHILIDKDGTIYQTASLYKRTNHVGRLRARCVVEHRCTPAETKALQSFNPRAEHLREQAKAAPDRYPSNQDSIGIELVGETVPNPSFGRVAGAAERNFVTVTDAQNASLKWLIGEISSTLRVPMMEVFRHPTVSRKTESEASTARW
ncbi:N-acetylmuramoyl-L-alanine amidase [Pseudomonas sp. RIT-PI-AD]|uniref:peptidoglycan recognition protein family protein n=1 Tax=Pseudomonas sp. RIT-PI-AD TaxID=3035294 RepID=UPI0021D96895|nr:N-acetylmuramoyl-L-alanine amidase [Pseudomonas sp. RIT-PI-AD]